MHKYESLRLDDYTLNPLTILKNYIIHNEKYKKGSIVYKAISKSTSQYVKIHKRPFIDSLASRHRFFMLINAFRKGIVLAENIFLSRERDSYYLYTIEPDLFSSKYEYVPLTSIIKGEELDYMRKQRLFQSILIAIKDLHGLGEAHLEISPKNIFVKDQLEVKLKPFRLDKPGHNIAFGNNKLSTGQFGKVSTNQPNNSNITKYWYIAPEQLLRDSKAFQPETFANETESSGYSNTYDRNPNEFASDMWSLGCVFSELFVTLTPIFQSVNPNDTIIKFFQVLGVPQLNEVPYMSLDLYTNIENELDQEQELPLIVPITQSLSKSEAQILTSLLKFDPNKRPTPTILLELPFFKAYTPQKYQHKGAVSLLQALQRPENSPLSYKKSVENLSSSAYQSQSRSTLRRQSASRETIAKHRLTSGFPRCNSTYSVVPINQGDWWNTSIIEPAQDNIDTAGGRSSNYRRSSSQLKERSHQFSSVKKTLDFKETEQTEKNEFETLQTFSDIEQTGHFEIQSPHYFSCNPHQQSDLSTQVEHKKQKIQHEDYEPVMNHHNVERQDYNSVARAPDSSSGYKRKSMINIKQNYNSTPTKYHQNQVFERPRPQERKDEHEQQMQYLESQQKLSKMSPLKAKAKAKLSVNIDSLKVKRTDRNASYGCRVILKNRDIEHSSKEKIDIFSCFAPMEDHKVKLDFKGEAELSAESFLQMYNNESLEIQVFYQKSSEFTEYDENVDSEATVYGVSKINLGLAVPQLYSLMGEGMPIRARRDWYPMCDPQYPAEVVGQLKLSISVEFTGNMSQYKNVKSVERHSQQAKPHMPLEERHYASQLHVKENCERKCSVREIDFYSEAGGSVQKKVQQKRPSYIMATPPKRDSVNQTFDCSQPEKKANRDVVAFDERAENVDYMGYDTVKKGLSWSNKPNQLRAKYMSHRLEM